MKRRSAVLLGAGGLLFAGTAALLLGAFLIAFPDPQTTDDFCVGEASQAKFSAELRDALGKPTGTLVDMGRIADFEWDTLLVFPPYTSAKTVVAKTGNPYVGRDVFGDVPEFETLLSFMFRGSEICRYSWGTGFIDSSTKEYARDHAKFVVHQRGVDAAPALRPLHDAG